MNLFIETQNNIIISMASIDIIKWVDNNLIATIDNKSHLTLVSCQNKSDVRLENQRLLLWLDDPNKENYLFSFAT